MQKRTIISILSSVYAGLFLFLDALTTLIAFRIGGVVENNPITAALGLPLATGVTLFGIVVLTAGSWGSLSLWRETGNPYYFITITVLAILIGTYRLSVVVNNLQVLGTLR